MWNDVRLALRYARQRPAYAVTCITVLAFGLGTCTAVFSALYSAVLKPLPYPDPDRLVLIHNRFPAVHLESMKASPADYATLSQHHELFSSTGAYYFLDLSRGGIEIPEKVNAVAVTSSLFRTLGVQPLLGRSFTDAEERYKGPHAVILSDAYWHSAFGADAGILNRTLILNGEPYAVVGVMPKSFDFPNNVTQMWVPLTFRNPADSRNYYLHLYARLAPGLDVARASARVQQLSRQIAIQNPQLHAIAPQGWSYFLTPMLRNDNPSVRRWMWILFAAGTCFLLIVCSNVAGLVLVRSSERRFEFAVRIALGAGKWRIVREVLGEVLVLTALGAAAGLAIARLGIALLTRYVPSVSPPDFEATIFWFSAAVALVTAVLCGLYPALHSAGGAAISAAGGLADGGFQRTSARSKRHWQQGLTVAQIAVATALLVCGGLLVQSLMRLLQTPLGFDPRAVLTMNISLPPLRYASPESRERFFTGVLEQTAALPGVQGAGACTLLPFGYGESVNSFEIVGEPKQPVAPLADLNTVSSEYFQVMRIPLIRGRVFTPQDSGGALLTLIDETFARRFFAGHDPIGKQVRMPWGVYTIAGVVGAVKTSGIETDFPPTMYFHGAQSRVTDMTLTIRSTLPENTIVKQVQRIVTGIDKDQPVYDIAPLQNRIDQSLKTRRFVAWLVLASATAGIGVAALGLYGLLSYTVALRRREIGIRAALGATSIDLAALVYRGGLALVAAGMALGSAAAVGAQRFIASQMYGVSIMDGLTWIAVLAIVAVMGLIASALPAWRAARQSPAEALRSE
jgi:putative ABC transport system permease protein